MIDYNVISLRAVLTSTFIIARRTEDSLKHLLPAQMWPGVAVLQV